MQLSGCKLLKGSSNGICIPAFEEHQITGLFRGGVLLQGEIHMVLFRNMGKCLDILVADFNVSQPRILPGKMFQRLLAPVDFRRLILPGIQIGPQSLFQNLFAHSGTVHDQDDGLAGDFFLH